MCAVITAATAAAVSLFEFVAYCMAYAFLFDVHALPHTCKHVFIGLKFASHLSRSIEHSSIRATDDRLVSISVLCVYSVSAPKHAQ